MKLDELNALEPVRFVAALAGVFEHSPWIGATVYDRRPFHSIDDLRSLPCCARTRSSQARRRCAAS